MLAYTGADAIMISRAARGQPWIFREISHFRTQASTRPHWWPEVRRLLPDHCKTTTACMARLTGVRSAREQALRIPARLPGEAKPSGSTSTR